MSLKSRDQATRRLQIIMLTMLFNYISKEAGFFMFALGLKWAFSQRKNSIQLNKHFPH